jgi:RNA polymerase sigma-70 factor (ECF subfamily)
MPNSPETEDLTQEAFAKVFEATAEGRPVSPKAYLYTAAHNVAMNHVRREKVRGSPPTIDKLEDEPADDRPDVERELIARQRVDFLWEALEQLSPTARQVFLMRKIDGMRNTEIAERLGLSVSSIEKHIMRGLRACKEYLDSREEEDALPDNRSLTADEGSKHG